jgi:D-alanyl-lipoteichoic acid acyltransferase DltB (MBOAT superfamily)
MARTLASEKLSRPGRRQSGAANMLFNSPEFLFGFLPVTLAAFFAIARAGAAPAAGWLVAASLFFYGWWDARYLALLAASIALNFAVGGWLARSRAVAGHARRRAVLALGIGANLALLGYYKYAGFFAATLNQLAGAGLPVPEIVLPLGISFFTFTQIAYLVDAARGEAADYNPVHYALFVTYYPHLIAGPILHHREMMPQFADAAVYRPDREALALGLTIFLLGLAKKVVLADGFSPYAREAFAAADAGAALTFFAAWGGALAYTLQLYFDFSGYSDMAVGLAKMMRIDLPVNFRSPYKAASIIDFWRRWHITLSRFLRDYLYLPLGGNRRGPARRYANLMITMLLGGLWHGAGWTFVLWGALHGAYLMVNHAWRGVAARLPPLPAPARAAGRAAGWALTFLAVVVAWVFFRAETLDGALGMLGAMAGANGAVLPAQLIALAPWLAFVADGAGNVPFLAGGTVLGLVEMSALLGLGLGIALLAPNVYEMSGRQRLAAVAVSFAFTLQQVLFGSASEFLYFRF